ncbi:TPA: hypothetical protein ACTXAG_001676, partial [Klebsiella oxytoca]
FNYFLHSTNSVSCHTYPVCILYRLHGLHPPEKILLLSQSAIAEAPVIIALAGQPAGEKGHLLCLWQGCVPFSGQ